MNKDLSIVFEEMCKMIDSYINSTNVGDMFFHLPIPSEQFNSAIGYMKYNFSDMIGILRIERLFELGKISEKTKNSLIDKYKKYKEILMNLDKSESDELKKLLEEQKKLIESELSKYGILNNFNIEESIIEEIDKEILEEDVKQKN